MSKQRLTDQEIIRLIRLGNHRQALKQVYEDNYGSIEHYILQNSGSHSNAKDIFQEAIIVFYTNVLKSDFKLRSAIKTYLYAIARNLWFKHLGRQDRTLELNDEVFNISVEESTQSYLEMDEQERTLLKALEKIGHSCKTILYLYYFHKKSMKEIAKIMDYTSAANARNQKYKCINRLRKLVLK